MAIVAVLSPIETDIGPGLRQLSALPATNLEPDAWAPNRRVYVFEPRRNGDGRRPDLSGAIVLVPAGDLSMVGQPVIFSARETHLLVSEEADLDALDARLTELGLQSATLAFFSGDPQVAINAAIAAYLCRGIFPQ